MSLIIGIVSPEKAKVYSDGAAVDANGLMVKKDYRKIFRISSGLLGVIGDAQAYRFATEEIVGRKLSFTQCWAAIRAFAECNPNVNGHFFLVGENPIRLARAQYTVDDCWRLEPSVPLPAAICHGFFYENPELCIRALNLTGFVRDGVLDFDDAEAYAQEFLTAAFNQVPAQIGGETFVETLNGCAAPSDVAGSAPQAFVVAATTSLSQSGTTKTINVGAGTYYFGNNTLNANSGSVTPGAYGTWFVYFDDPGWGGGAVTYQATTNSLVISQNPYRVFVGKITTSSSGGGTGGVGGIDFCFSPNTQILTNRGNISIVDVRQGDLVLTARGTWKPVDCVTTRDYNGKMLDMGDGELVTPTHLFRFCFNWVPIEEIGDYPHLHYKGTIHNLHIPTDPDDDGTAPNTEHSYQLANGWFVHNVQTV